MASIIFPNQFPAVLKARLRSGEVYERRVSHNRGGPDNPLSDRELETKFHVNAGRVMAEERVGGLWETLGSLGEAESMGEVARLARSGG
jgi:2-methylcitrate dehydratase PrpD